MWMDQDTTLSNSRRNSTLSNSTRNSTLSDSSRRPRKSTSKAKSRSTSYLSATVLQLFASEVTLPESKRKPRFSRRLSTYTDVMLTVVDTGDTTVVPLSSLYDEALNQVLPEKSDVIENSVRSVIENSIAIEKEVKRNLLSHLRSSRYRVTHRDPRNCNDKECTDSVLSDYLSSCNRNKLTPRLYVQFPSRLATPSAA